MLEIFEKILLLALIPVITMITGGLLAMFLKINSSWRSVILHFAAGVVFSVVAVELLPDIVAKHSPVQVVIGFSLGIVVMILIIKLTEPKQDQEGKKAFSFNMLFAIGIDIVVDGILLGIGFSAGVNEGILLSIALSVELLSLGMAVIVALKKVNPSKLLMLFLLCSLALLFFVSAVSGAILLHNLTDNTMEVVLSFGLSSLLFLVTEELLTEAHEEQETIWHTASFFFGFLLFLILGMLL